MAGTQLYAREQPELPEWHPGAVLTSLEVKIVAAAAAGELVDCGEGRFDLAEMQTWSEERTVRAAVLRHLLVAGTWPLDAKGVQLCGVRISGHLDLQAATLRCALLLDSCYLDADEPVCFEDATASHVTLIRCQLAGLTGDMLTARKLDLSSSTLTGPLILLNANIAGQLICSGARLTGRDADGNALVGDGLKVGGELLLDKGFTAAGAIRLPGADIGLQLNCCGAKLTGADKAGNALVGDGLKVSGDLFLNGDNGPRSDGFTAAGTVSLNSVHVGRSVWLAPTGLIDEDKVALDLTRADIAGKLRWTPGRPVKGRVCLEDATVGELDDDWSGERAQANGYWPTGGRLRLNGFTYGRLGGEPQATVAQRLEWIRSQYQPRTRNGPAAFTTQPYEQLVAAYRQSGQDGEARKVLVAMANDNPGVSLAASGNDGSWSWWNANSAVIVGVLSVAIVAIRLLGVARGDPEMAYAILEDGGTGTVLIATLISTLGLLAAPVFVLIAVYAWRIRRLGYSSMKLQLLAVIAVGLLFVAAYMSPVLFLIAGVVEAVIIFGFIVLSPLTARFFYIFFVSLYVLVAFIYGAFTPTPWLPVQAITISGQDQPFSGYVLTQANGLTSILTSDPEGVINVPPGSVRTIRQCVPPNYQWEQATIFDLIERAGHKIMTFPSCPSAPYNYSK